MQTYKKVRNNSIDLFRYFCSVLIVIIHAHPLADFSPEADKIVIDYVTRIGVPFFFVVSGFFYTKKLDAGKYPFGPYMKNLLVVYLLWSLVYSLVNYYKYNGFTDVFFKKLWQGLLFRGVSEHLWFLLSLMFAIIVLTLVDRFNLEKVLYVYCILAYIIVCFGFTYRNVIGSKIPFLEALYSSPYFTEIHRFGAFGICFVTLGSVIARYEKKLTKPSGDTYFALVVICYAVFVAEKAVATHFNFGSNNLYNFALVPMVLFVYLFLLKYPLPNLDSGVTVFKNASSFVYYSHPLALWLGGFFITSSILRFAFAFCVCSVISFTLTRIDNKALNVIN